MSKNKDIQTLIKKNGIRISWLADKLDLRQSTLSYLLQNETDIDDDLSKKIKDLISSYQFEFNFFEEDHTKKEDLFDSIDEMDIGQRIRAFAKKKYGTMTKLAEIMDISPQQLHQYVSGNREPGSKILVKLLKAGCDINWLLSGIEKDESYKIIKLQNEIKNLKTKLAKIAKILS